MKLFSFRMRTISVFIFDTGMSTRRCFDPQALRIRVNMSAIGSVMLIELPRVLSYPETWRRCVNYQLAFLTPGIIPDRDSSRKQIRQRPKRRKNARGRPQRPQGFCFRPANFG